MAVDVDPVVAARSGAARVAGELAARAGRRDLELLDERVTLTRIADVPIQRPRRSVPRERLSVLRARDAGGEPTERRCRSRRDHERLRSVMLVVAARATPGGGDNEHD